MKQKTKLNAFFDALFSHSLVYGVIAFALVRAHASEQAFGLQNVLNITADLRWLVYLFCGAVYAAYAYRFISGAISRKQSMLFLTLSLFAELAVVTFVFNGASGYDIDWHAGIALMMMLDMGLQRERESVLGGMAGALMAWSILHLLTVLIYPQGFTAQVIFPLKGLNDPMLPLYLQGITEPFADPYFVPDWLLGTRVYYYRILFSALVLEIIRAQCLRGKWTMRTWAMLAISLVTVGLQRGGTAILGMAMLLCALVFFNRRALPRYASPLVMLVISALLFVGVHYFKIQNLFGYIVSGVLGKDMTFSGRTDAWAAAMALVGNNPITGVGLLPLAYMRQYLGVTHTHNHLLELFLHGGLLAVGIYTAMVAVASREALKYRRYPAVKTAAILLTVFVFMGTAEIFHNDPLYYPLFMLLFRAECLEGTGKKLPRISVFTRIKRDLKRKKKEE